MADTVTKQSITTKGGTLFSPELVTDLINKTKGESALAMLCGMTPIPFNGIEEWTFSLDDEVNLVAEGGAKSKGNMSLNFRRIIPLKVEYSVRVSNEFMWASDEAKLEILKNFNEGFARKLARGLDIMALHGVNPRSGEASSLIGDNYFDSGVEVITDGTNANDKIENGIAYIQGKDYDADGIGMAPAFRSELSKLTYNDGRKMFPELTWGGMAGTLNGLNAAQNNTFAFGGSDDLALLGDFRRGFKWGYSKRVATEIIEFGDPDNSGRDLKGHNEVMIRAEAFIGWGILDKNAFALIKKADSE